MRKVFSVGLAGLVLAATVAAGGSVVLAQDEEPFRGGRLELVALNDIATLDNSQAVDTIQYNTAAGALYEGLYHFTPQGELEAGLADGLPEVSADGLVYTFHLKPGAMFAGPDFEPRAVTAADVAYGMTRALDPTPEGAASPSWGSGYLFPIKGAAAFNAGEVESVEGIEVIDEGTLQVTLEAPSSTFLLGLTIATSWPVPSEAVAERGEDFGNRPVGAGPFYVKEWNKGSDITLARNPGYVDPGLPYLDEIHVDLSVDENTQVLRLESGEADGVFEPFTIGPAGLRTLAEAPGLTVTDAVGPRIYYLALENGGLFANRDLRMAVAHAVTRDFTAQFGDLAQPWNQLMGSTTLQSDPEGTRIYPHDPDTARELLEFERLRRQPGQDHLRRQRPVRLGQRHGATPGPGGRGLRRRADRHAAGRVLRGRGLRSCGARPVLDLLERRLPRRAGLHLDELRVRLVPQHLALLRRGHRRSLLRDRADALRN